jgi:hypothetical protein
MTAEIAEVAAEQRTFARWKHLSRFVAVSFVDRVVDEGDAGAPRAQPQQRL